MAYLAVILAIPQGAFAWGREGHQIIVILAEHYMRPETATHMQELLSPESLEEASVWADEYRHDHCETGPWHYIDIPLADSNIDLAGERPNGDCVIAKTEQFLAVLKDPNADKNAKAQESIYPASSRHDIGKWQLSEKVEQPTRLRILRGEGPRAVNYLFRTASISGACGGNEAWRARTQKSQTALQETAVVGATRVASKTNLQQRLVKTGGRLIKHARYYWLLLAGSHMTRRLFGAMVGRIAVLPVPAG